MIRILSAGALILYILLVRTSAQLLSCSEIQCPMDNVFSECKVEGTKFPLLGVANFSSSLSPENLTWTVGYITAATINDTDQKRYFLGTPRGLDLNARTDLTGCALFFTGIESSLRFKSNGSATSEGSLSGSCGDALGSICVSDLTNQARDLVANSTTSGELRCSDIAQALQSSPPGSCIRGGTWGNITAKTITGPDSPVALQLDNCNPTGHTSYDARDVATFENNFDRSYILKVTPLMTIFAPNGNASTVMSNPEVSLQCMKPIKDIPPNGSTAQGIGQTLSAKNSYPAIFLALTGAIAMKIFIG